MLSPSRALVLGAVAVLLVQATRFGNTWTDDAYISFRYSRQWLNGQGMAFNPGERLEGLTNLGWAMMLAPFAEGDILTASQVLGLLCGVGTILALVHYSRGVGLEAGAASLAVFTVPVWVPYWMVQGLEPPAAMLATTLGWAFFCSDLRRFGAGARWGLAAVGIALGPWFRPDGALLAIVLGCWFIWRRAGPKERFSLGVGLAVLTVLISAALLVGLKLYWFGEILPNTFHVKVGEWPPERGIQYMISFLKVPSPALPLIIVVAVVRGLIWAIQRDDRALPSLVFLAASAAVVVQNGDFMANFRLLVPWWPAAAAAVGLLVHDALERWTPSRDRRIAAGVAFALALVGPGSIWSVDRLNQESDSYVNAWFAENTRPGWDSLIEQGPFPVAWAVVNAGVGERVACTELGLISYVHDGPILDLLGLTDRVMGRRDNETPSQRWRSVEERATWLVVHTGSGAWQRFGPSLATSGWRPVAGCNQNWMFQNPAWAGRTARPDRPTLEARLRHVLARAPRHRYLLEEVARELANAGESTELLRSFYSSAAELGPMPVWDGARADGGLADDCMGPYPRETAAVLGDVNQWPAFGEVEPDVDLGDPRCLPLRNDAAGAWDAARDAWAASEAEGRDDPRKQARGASGALRGREADIQKTAASALAAAEAVSGASSDERVRDAAKLSRAAWEKTVLVVECDAATAIHAPALPAR